MKLTILGCSGSFPGPSSPASGYLVQAEHEGRTWNLVLDLGNGALGQLQRFVDLRDLDAVVLSHLHPDHFMDMCGLYVAHKYRPGRAARVPRIPVFGPRGTERRLRRAYDDLPDRGDMARSFAFADLSDRVPFQVGPFAVTPYRVNHPVEAYGVRVDVEGTVLAYTGDTDACDALRPLAHGADLLLSDAAFIDGRDKVEGIHLSGRRAAEAAVAAEGVKRLMLTHIPPWNDPQVCRSQAAEVWPGEVELAVQGASYDL